ncbi:MAG: RDD family protein [Minicystis sp.]
MTEHNPYAPPRNHDEDPVSDRGGRTFERATLGARFGGALIDGLFGFVLVYALRAGIAMGTEGTVPSFMELYGPKALERGGFTGLGLSMVPLVIMGTLIAKRGQSVGKIVMGTRIVRPDGRTADFVHGFALRTLPLTAIALVPSLLVATGTPLLSVQPLTMLTSLVSFIDAVLIFGAERRCLHDRIGGTYVAQVGTERPADEDAPRPMRRKKRKAADAS